MTNYGYNDNSCASEDIHSCADIAYQGYGPMQHQIATEGAGTPDDPITCASDTSFSQGGATLTPGTIVYNTITQKYYVMEDSCAECEADYKCQYDDDENKGPGDPPAGCKDNTYFHIDFWMGPNSQAEPDDGGALNNCEDNSTIGDCYNINNAMDGGVCIPSTNGTVIVNPPSNLPVRPGLLYQGVRVVPVTGGCWTTTQVTPNQAECR
jgi:hypothetical protein